MITLFHDLPEAISNSEIIAKRCSFSLKEKTPILPKFFKTNSFKSEDDLLTELSKNGLRTRLSNTSLQYKISEEL